MTVACRNLFGRTPHDRLEDRAACALELEHLAAAFRERWHFDVLAEKPVQDSEVIPWGRPPVYAMMASLNQTNTTQQRWCEPAQRKIPDYLRKAKSPSSKAPRSLPYKKTESRSTQTE